MRIGKTTTAAAVLVMTASPVAYAQDKTPYPVPDTMQNICYNATTKIVCPKVGEAFAGQDASTRIGVSTTRKLPQRTTAARLLGAGS